MPTLTITRGLPASGKSTWAKAWAAEDPERRTRVNRDELRAMLGYPPIGNADQERAVTDAQHAMVTALLRRGLDVVCDDMFLRSKYVRTMRDLATAAGAEFEVKDFTFERVDVCVARDAARDRSVGEDVIRGLHARFLAGKPYPLPLPDDAEAAPAREPYVPQVGAATAILCDLDGTIAHMHDRSPYPGPEGEDRCGEDTPNEHVIAAVEAMWAAGHEVIFMSGRTEACRAQTEAWLRKRISFDYLALYMRAVGDQRKDSQVKLDLFDRYVRKMWDVIAVFDDRDQVIAAWRSIGLTVFQVAPGAF